MSREPYEKVNLSAFEAALASLAPRVEGFDRERLFFLAGQASLLGDGEAGSLPASAVGGTSVGRSALAEEQRVARRVGRWGWPAAFSVMTAVAAALLVMLCLRSEPPVPNAAVPIVARGVGVPAIAGNKAANGMLARPAAAEKVAGEAAERGRLGVLAAEAVPLPSWLSLGPPAHRASRLDLADSTSYAELREQALRHGLESYRPKLFVPAGKQAPAEEALPYHQWLERLLAQEPFAS